MPTPSASICSSSGVAPPVINVRINVNALSLKYVCNKLYNFVKWTMNSISKKGLFTYFRQKIQTRTTQVNINMLLSQWQNFVNEQWTRFQKRACTRSTIQILYVCGTLILIQTNTVLKSSFSLNDCKWHIIRYNFWWLSRGYPAVPTLLVFNFSRQIFILEVWNILK